MRFGAYVFNSHSTSKNQNYKSSHYITSIKLSHHHSLTLHYHPLNKLYQIHTQFIKTTLSDFDTEFDKILIPQA
nr:MAG TPA: hypothetical protein [Caudoviricetes sp.]